MESANEEKANTEIADQLKDPNKKASQTPANESFLRESWLYVRRNFESVKFCALIDAILLLLCVILFYVNEYLITPYISSTASGTIYHYLISSHANDLLGGIAFMTYTNLLISLVRPELRFKKFRSTFIYILFCGLFWEYAAPLFVANSVSDPLDILVYLTGAALYWIVLLATRTKHKEFK